MRHIALLLGFLLVLSSLVPGHRLSGGAMLADLQPVGALPTGTDTLGQGNSRSEPEPANGGESLFCQGFAGTSANLCPDTCSGSANYFQPVLERVIAADPARAPPRCA